MWDVDVSEPYQTVANAMNELYVNAGIASVFYTKESLGKDSNVDFNRPEHPPYNHLYYKFKQSLSTDYISIESMKGSVNTNKNLLERSFNEITPSAVTTVLDLVNEKTLYRGEEFSQALRSFKTAQTAFIKSKNKETYLWQLAVSGRSTAIKTTVIGTLLTDISNGIDLETAVAKYESKVAPSNYKRPKALFTKAMKKAAEDKATELGLLESLPRRHAKMEDINVQDVLWVSGESKKLMQSGFDMLPDSNTGKKRNLANIESVNIDQFIAEILPQAKTFEVLFKNKHTNNLMSLIAPVNPNAKSMFQWKNPFSWSYNNNATDSEIRESVKARGGNVIGDLRFSIMWAEGDSADNSDLDAHCIWENPQKNGHIYFSAKRDSNTGGSLDVDITNPRNKGNKDIVENIVFPDKSKMPNTVYKFFVKNFSNRGSKGFKAEIEFEGQILSFNYPHSLRNKEKVVVAEIMWDGKEFSIVKSMDSTATSREVWNIPTENFVKVNALMYSPNFWSSGNNKGNRHHFFILENCKTSDHVRGFYNEFLLGELTPHRKVFEALGNTMRVEPIEGEDQMSGLGISSTKSEELTVKVNNRIFNIKFNSNESIRVSSTKKVQV